MLGSSGCTRADCSETAKRCCLKVTHGNHNEMKTDYGQHGGNCDISSRLKRLPTAAHTLRRALWSYRHHQMHNVVKTIMKLHGKYDTFLLMFTKYFVKLYNVKL